MERKLDINDNPKINYIKFNELPVLKEEQMIPDAISSSLYLLTEIPKWEKNFNALIYFRCLNKQNPVLLKSYIPKMITLLSKLSLSIRSALAKLTLILIGEILQFYKIDNDKAEIDYQLLNQLLSIILHSTFNTKLFIKTEAKACLKENLEKNQQFHTFELCIELIDLMKSDKGPISDSAFEGYEIVIDKVNFENISKETWIKFTDRIDELYNKKREIYTKKAIKIISYVSNKLTNAKFNQTLSEIGKEDKIQLYNNWMKYIVKKNTSGMSLKEFKKQQKAITKKEE